MMKKFLTPMVLLLCAAVALLAGCGGAGGHNAVRGLNAYNFTKASLSATDREGRQIDTKKERKTDSERYVGVFYWLWMGNHDHQFGIYDNTKLMSTPDGEAALFNVTNPPGEGMQNASPMEQFHWTNEPLYGYYNSSDPWVISRHIELLTMADVDFVFFDTTNHAHYQYNYSQHTIEASKITGSGTVFMDTLLEYYDQGWDVPQVIFYTNTKSGERVNEIYEHYYKSGKYDKLWFAPDGKPMIVGTSDKNDGASDMWDTENFIAVSDQMLDYFDVMESQWPGRPENKDFALPWMSWEYPQHYHTESKAVSVSVAQHSSINVLFSSRHKWSNRGYDYHTDSIQENWAAGKNFENEWETVFNYESQGKQVRFVMVTGWNEWITFKQQGDAYITPENPTGMMMVDNFDSEYSRDIEMDKEHYQDNSYLQLVSNVRNYKYAGHTSNYRWQKKTVRSLADFNGASAVYKDFAGETRARDFYGFDIRSGSVEAKKPGSWYSDFSNRNDIVETRVLHDDKNLYFRIETKDAITPYTSGENWMNVLIKTGAGDTANTFGGYQYIINRSPASGRASVERSRGGWNWESVGSADMTVQGNQMMITVPRAMLGLNSSLRFEFKVSDNVCKPSWFKAEDAEHDIMHYYITGDSAPIGRLNYTYGY